MQAIIVNKTGPSDVLERSTIQDPIPKSDEVKIQVEAAGVNFIDIYFRTGLYPRELPIILGQEASGIVIDLGEDAAKFFEIGDRVAGLTGGGSYAQYVCAPLSKTVKIPDDIDTETAIAALLQGLTAHYLSSSTYKIQRDDSILIQAAAGGTGGLLVQIAKMKGARVIGTTSTKEKAEKVMNLGADHVLGYDNIDEFVMKLTEGKGVNVVYDSVGRTTFNASLNSLRARGTLALFGQSSGLVENFHPNDLSSGSKFLTRPRLWDYIQTRNEFSQRILEIFDWISNNQVKFPIYRVLPLEQAKEAHDLLENRMTSGKLILKP